MTVDAKADAALRRGRYGARLRRERKAVGLSQEDLAGEAGLSLSAVSQAERGVGSPEEALAAIEAALDLPVVTPGAPRDPVRRMAWFDERNRLLAGAKPPPSGTFGQGKVAS